MSDAIKNLLQAQEFAMRIRPNIGGFPVLAEALRHYGITKNIWHLPSCQSIYITKYGPVVQPGFPLINQVCEVPKFNELALIQTLRKDQSGESTFPQFLKSSWEAGVTSYVVDFEKRVCTYFGVNGETYTEEYPKVEITF